MCCHLADVLSGFDKVMYGEGNVQVECGSGVSAQKLIHRVLLVGSFCMLFMLEYIYII